MKLADLTWDAQVARFPTLNWRVRSLLRANLAVGLGLVLAFKLSGLPNLRRSPALTISLVLVLAGMLETGRCMRKTWDLYHGGVLFMLYGELMVVTLVLFLLIYPYLI